MRIGGWSINSADLTTTKGAGTITVLAVGAGIQIATVAAVASANSAKVNLLKELKKMAIQGYTQVGKLYAKKFYNRKLALNASVEAFAGFIIPPFVVPNRYWLRARVGTVEGTTPFPPHFFMDYLMNGRIVSLPSNFDADLAANDTLQEMTNQFAPVGDNTPGFDEQTGMDAGHNKIGTSVEFSKPLGMFFHREKRLGLPDSAVFQSSDSIYMFDHFATKGTIKPGLKDVEEGSLLTFTAWFDEPAGGTTELSNLIGSNTAGRTLNDLSVEILAHFEDNPYSSAIAENVDPDTELFNWLSIGQIFDALPVMSGDEAINIAVHLTVEMDVVAPRGQKTLSAPG